MNNQLDIEVVYAKPEKQTVIALSVAEGVTIQQAIEESGILQQFPEIDLQKQKVGVFSQLRRLSDQVKEGNRIEIYRRLSLDPKERRRQKAKGS